MSNKKSLRILQWNCRSITRKYDLHNHAKDFDIIILIETWLKPEHTYHLYGFETVRFDRLDEKGGGLGIFVRKNIEIDVYDLNLKLTKKSLEMGAITIEVNNKKMIIVAVYRPPHNNNKISFDEWSKLVEEVKRFDYFLIAGDLNAHHPLWGSNIACYNGRIIADMYDPEDLLLLNNGSATHFTGPNCSESNIDLSFISPSLGMSSSWTVLDDSWGSDHMPIIIEIDIQASTTKKNDYRYNLRKVDWQIFYNYLENAKNSFMGLEFLNADVSVRYERFIDSLINAIEFSLPMQKNKQIDQIQQNVRKTKPVCIWWNEECERAVRIRKAKFKSLKHKMSREQFFEFKKCDAKTKAILRNTKKESFRTFCETINPRSNISNIWTKVKLFKNKNTRPLSFTGNSEKIKNMKEGIDNLCSPKMYVNSKHNVSELTADDSVAGELEAPFSLEELEIAISKSNFKSSPGHDKINFILISVLPVFYKRVLLELYNDFFGQCRIPEDWSKYLLLFIPKGSSNKVRPISMASCLLKLMERMICERLTWWVERNNKLSNTQYGFRKGKSCMNNLSILTTDIHNSFFKKKMVGAIFLDIKGAYDNVVPELLVDDLIDLGLPRNIIFFIKNLVSERELVFVNYTEAISKKTYKGLPQGSVLSPLLYAIYTRNIKASLDNGVKISEFADDLAAYLEIEKVQDLVTLERETQKLANNLEEKNLSLALEKCKLVIFHNNRKKPQYSFNISNTKINNVDEVKFLGINLDRKLSWNSHINKTIVKCQAASNIISCLRGVWWGSDTSVLLMIYNALVKSRIEYGGFLISPCTESNMSKLRKIQNSGLRMCMGYRKSTPINVILAESKVISLECRFEMLAYTFLIKNLSINNNALIDNLEITKELLEHPILSRNYKKSTLSTCFDKIWFLKDTMICSDIQPIFNNDYEVLTNRPKIDLSSGLSISKSNTPSLEFNRTFREEEENSVIHVYTDGSKIVKNEICNVGFAVHSKEKRLCSEYKINDKASIFTAECLALESAIEAILKHEDLNFSIFSDSRSALEALNHLGIAKNESPLITRLRKLLFVAKENGKNVNLIWIPAHVNIEGNEIADSRARHAAANGRYLSKGIPFSDLVPIYKTKCKENNETLLKERGRTKGHFYFQKFYNTKSKPWFHKMTLSRKTITSVNRMRANHTSLNVSLFKINVVNSELCECGESNDSPDHIFWECTRFERERKYLLEDLCKHRICAPYSIYSLIQEPKEPIMKIINKFICSIDKKI